MTSEYFLHCFSKVIRLIVQHNHEFSIIWGFELGLLRKKPQVKVPAGRQCKARLNNGGNYSKYENNVWSKNQYTNKLINQ